MEKTLYSFTGGKDGRYPVAGLVQGKDGNFYGTTQGDGTNFGSVFRITPAGVFTTLHSFTNGSDGSGPHGALVQGTDGNFYGTTSGDYDTGTYGTVYRITSAGVLTTLHTFTYGNDGGSPTNALVQGTDGNFYGTTSGGPSSYGTVFRITPAGVLTTLHTFTNGSDGETPGALVQGTGGNFYGTTDGDSVGSDRGTVYRITPAGALTTLHTFTGGNDGGDPIGGLVLGSGGNFYGTTYLGGSNGAGTVYRITSAGALTTLYTFTGFGDGGNPSAALIQGSDGDFYGTNAFDGGSDGNETGTVFRITPAGVLTTLYTFTGGSDGGYPFTPLVQGSDGSFYGTASDDSILVQNGNGTVFKLTILPDFFTDQTALSNGVEYLDFSSNNYFGYYSFLSDPHYLYHFDLGYEYVFDAADGKAGVYLYDFKSNTFFYTSPTFPFPYLYDFTLNTVLYYYPDPSNAGRYNTDGIRYFYDFKTGQTIEK